MDKMATKGSETSALYPPPLTIYEAYIPPSVIQAPVESPVSVISTGLNTKSRIIVHHHSSQRVTMDVGVGPQITSAVRRTTGLQQCSAVQRGPLDTPIQYRFIC